MERGYLSHYRNSVKKTASPRKISLKSGNRLRCLVMAKKTIFKIAVIRRLESLKVSYLVTWLSSSSKCSDVHQISSKSDDFSLRYGDFTIFKMADLRHLEF